MKILLGGSNFTSSNIMLSRFLDHLTDDIRICAWYRNHQYLPWIDWCLDAVHKHSTKNYFQIHHGIKGPSVDHGVAINVLDDILDWGPDLVISDCESFTACVAKVLGIPLWYCSGILQFNAIEHKIGAINNNAFLHLRDTIKVLPKGDLYLVYSGLCDIECPPILKDGFEWVKPYNNTNNHNKIVSSCESSIESISTVIPDGYLLCSGETSLVGDCLYSGMPFYVCPDPLDQECLLNAQMLQHCGCAVNIGRPKSLEFVKTQVEKPNNAPKMSDQYWNSLDEKVVKWKKELLLT